MISFWAELRRRNVVRVTVAYLAAAWVLIEVVDTLGPIVNAPSWIPLVAVFSAALGLPLAVLLAWFYDVTPEGIKATSELEVADAAGSTSRRLNFAIIGLLVFALSFVVVDQYVVEETVDTVSQNLPAIAALPFSNESAAEEDAEFFANGIHDQLLTQLAKLGAFKVISRTSVMEYRDTAKNMREIGAELGVTSLLEGRVQRAGDVVRINVQLIDARTDAHLWAETYDRELTAENVFSIQAEMATAIAAALEQTLSPEQTARLAERPTLDTRAYDFYLTGNDYANRAGENRAGRRFTALALEQYEQAVDEDPGFALAWAALSGMRSRTYWRNPQGEANQLGRALDAANRAFDLVPDLPEAHLAMGLYYAFGFRDWDSALDHYVTAQRGMPGNTDVMQAIAGTYRRLGNGQAALNIISEALVIDPRNTRLLRFHAGTYAALRDSTQAQAQLDRILEITPDNLGVHEAKVRFGLFLGDDLASVRANAAPLVDARDAYFPRWLLGIRERNFEAVEEFLDNAPDDVWEGSPKELFYAVTYRLAGQQELARQQFAAARNELEALVQEEPENFWRLLDLAEATVGLGHVEEGVGLAERALMMMPVETDWIAGKLLQAEAILRVFVPAGDFARATQLLDDQLSSFAGWGLEGFLADPRLDPLLDDPGFQGLERRYARDDVA